MASQGRLRRGLRERFYRSIAETLALLHSAGGTDRRAALQNVAELLCTIMELPLVWIGRVAPDATRIEVYAAAGAAVAYADGLHLDIREAGLGGQGPTATAIREGRATVTGVDAPEFAPWRLAAESHGLGWYLVAATTTADGGRLTLSVYSRTGPLQLGVELLDWAQRLADQLGRFWDHRALLAREARLRRYRDAQRAIQRVLLEQPDPASVYRTLANALVDVAGAEAVDVWADDGHGEMLQRMALVGPMASAIAELPDPPRCSDGPVYTPTLAFMSGESVVRVRPATHPQTHPLWHTAPLSAVGALGCWPLFGNTDTDAAGHSTVGVFVIVAMEEDAFDREMCSLLDEIADAAGLALKQHAQRRALFEEQARQTYLALHDDLTRLPNRRALDRHLERVLARASRQQRLVAVGMLDMDDLKPINDRYGHAAGDRVLAEIAGRMRAALRAEDYVARLGGDEFVLVFENLDQMAELDPLLQRVCHALNEPILIDGGMQELSASLGVAWFPLHADASGAQLLRRADQAMYAVKAHKRSRASWWGLPPEGSGEALSVTAQDARLVSPYGPEAASLLATQFAPWAAKLPELVGPFYQQLLAHDGVSGSLGYLPQREVRAVQRRLVQHLRGLLRPQLTEAAQQRSATGSGTFNAAWGMEEVWLLEGIELLRSLFATRLNTSSEGDRRPLEIVLQRLTLEQQWQLESMRELQRRRVALLGELNVLAWSADSYVDLTQGVVDILASHEEIAACAVGRPDAHGELIYEAVAGEIVADYLHAVSLGVAVSISVDQKSPHGRGPAGRAWREATIQRSPNYATDPAVSEWRDTARRLGILSNVAVPLCPVPQMPAAILIIYCPYIGGFQSEDQQAFISQVKSVLDLALSRLAPPRPGTALLPFFVREGWRKLIADEAVQMYYQPVVRLADGRVTELEGLARLPTEDGKVLLPGVFLPALGETELVSLFHQAVLQAMACRQTLVACGFELDMSVNAPAAALEDKRYPEAAAAALALGPHVPGTLLLEILESPLGTEHSSALAKGGMETLKELGFRLVEDDLGAGFSSLIRLRQWPFDRVKIDQAIVLQAIEDPLRTVRFIRQLIRLGHDLGLEVVVEGLETPGMIEAALILGADFGQGYALARPMPPANLPTWLTAFQPDWDAESPRSCLGQLAAALVWEEQFIALPPDPMYWQRHAATSFVPADPATGAPARATLYAQRDAMHAASAHGPHGKPYSEARDRYFSLLVDGVLVQERRQD